MPVQPVPVGHAVIAPTKPAKSALSHLVDALGAAAPGIRAKGQQDIAKKANDDAIKAQAEADRILASPQEDKDTIGAIKEWREATNENPTLMALNPFAQQRAREDVARASARALEPLLDDEVNKITTDIDDVDDFQIAVSKIQAFKKEKLEALGPLDTAELSAFNAEFNQMEQNFVAQYNGRISGLKREAGKERLGNSIATVIKDKEVDSLLGGVRPQTADDIAARITKEAEDTLNSGAVLRVDRNGVVLQSTADALVELHERTGNGLDLLDDGVLDKTSLSIDQGKKISLGEWKQGKYADEIRTRMQQVDARKQQVFKAAEKQAQSDFIDQVQTRANVISRMPEGQDKVDAWNALDRSVNSPEAVELVGTVWAGKDYPAMVNAATNLADKTTDREWDTGFPRGAKYTELTRELDTGTVVDRVVIDQALADGTISKKEHKELSLQAELMHSSADAEGNLTYSQSLKNLHAWVQGVDTSSRAAILDYDLGQAVFAERSPQDIRFANVAINKLNILKGQFDALEEPFGVDREEARRLQDAMRQTAQQLNGTISGMEQVEGAEGKREVFSESRQLEIMSAATTSLSQVSPEELVALPIGKRLTVLDRIFTKENLQTNDPEMSPDTAQLVVDTYNNYIRNDPDTQAPLFFNSQMKDLGKMADSLASLRGELSDIEIAGEDVALALSKQQVKELHVMANLLGDARIERRAFVATNQAKAGLFTDSDVVDKPGEEILQELLGARSTPEEVGKAGRSQFASEMWHFAKEQLISSKDPATKIKGAELSTQIQAIQQFSTWMNEEFTKSKSGAPSNSTNSRVALQKRANRLREAGTVSLPADHFTAPRTREFTMSSPLGKAINASDLNIPNLVRSSDGKTFSFSRLAADMPTIMFELTKAADNTTTDLLIELADAGTQANAKESKRIADSSAAADTTGGANTRAQQSIRTIK